MPSLKIILKSKFNKIKRQKHINQIENELGITECEHRFTQKYLILKPGRWYKETIESDWKVKECERVYLWRIKTPFCWKSTNYRDVFERVMEQGLSLIVCLWVFNIGLMLYKIVLLR